MQLHARAQHPVDAAHQHDEAGLDVTVQSHLVHPVEGDVDDAGDVAFHHHGAAHQVAHQAAHGGEAAQRDQGAVVVVEVGLHLAAVHLGQDVLERLGRHLVGGLGAGRHELAVRLRAGGAVADDEDVLVTGGLQGLFHHQLVDAVGLEARYLLHEVRRLDARGPHHEVCFNQLPILGVQTLGSGFGDHGGGAHVHPELDQLLVGGAADALRQGRQDAGACLHQCHLEAVGGEVLEAVGIELLHRVVELGGEFDAGGAATHDGDLHLVTGLVFGGELQEAVHHAVVEAVRLGGAVQEDAVILDALGVEVVGHRTNRHHQHVVSQFPLVDHQGAALVVDRRQHDAFLVALDVGQAAELEFEAVVLGVGLVAQGVDARIHGAGGHFVQQGLPQVGAVAIHQGDPGLVLLAQLAAQAGRELETAGATAYNDNIHHDDFPWFLKTKGSHWLPKTKSVDVMAQASLKAFIRCRWCEMFLNLWVSRSSHTMS
ncbi:hypothetical protein D3C80_973240 [compost metagenome]